MWRQDEIKILINAYGKNLSVAEICKLLPNRTRGSIVNKAYRLNVSNRPVKYSNEIRQYIADNYKGWNIQELSSQTGIHKTNICRLVRQMGIERKGLRKENPKYKHFPDGKYRRANYKGLTKEEAVQKMLEAANKRTKESRRLAAIKMVKTRTANKGYGNAYSRTKSGKRFDLGGKFFRSSWEANYARYLNFIGVEWEYEPKRFYFEGIKRGTMSYMPDFKITKTGEWKEVKGWMDQQSKTRLKRFKKYYPHEFDKLELIDAKRYKEIEKEFKEIIPFWE